MKLADCIKSTSVNVTYMKMMPGKANELKKNVIF